MLHYPKIPDSRQAGHGRCVVFEKYDGTNLHWDWERDFGWHSFGTRRDAFNLTAQGIADFQAKHDHLTETVTIFETTLADGCAEVFNTHPAYQMHPRFKIFAEFLGAHSFAGLHKNEDPKELRLFDVEAEGFGLLGPQQFVRDFGHLPIARVLYQGKFTGALVEDVRRGRYNVAEGVICKGGSGGSDLWMVKIKTAAYLERLKQAFAERWEEYWE